MVLALMERIGEQTTTGLIYITHHEEEMIPCIDHILKLEKSARSRPAIRPLNVPGLTLREKSADLVGVKGEPGE